MYAKIVFSSSHLTFLKSSHEFYFSFFLTADKSNECEINDGGIQTKC